MRAKASDVLLPWFITREFGAMCYLPSVVRPTGVDVNTASAKPEALAWQSSAIGIQTPAEPQQVSAVQIPPEHSELLIQGVSPSHATDWPQTPPPSAVV
jgi:hypothetical protein